MSIYHILVHKRVMEAIHTIITERHKNLKCQNGHNVFSHQNIY